MPFLIGAKILRVDVENDVMHVWFGGQTVYTYRVKLTEKAKHKVAGRVNPDHPSFSEVKNKMRTLLGLGERKGRPRAETRSGNAA